jgi:hypothetical protein
MGSMVQEIGTSLGGLCAHVEKLYTSVNEMKTGLTAVEDKFEKMENKFGEVENNLGEVENRLKELENKFEERENKFENRFEEMQNRFERVENQSLNVEDRPTFKDRQREAMDEMENARSDQATQVDPNSDFNDAKNPNEYAYVVAGGYGQSNWPLNSVEIFDKTNNSWIQLEPMKTFRAEASSVVYNGQVLVTGGTSNGNNFLSSMKQLNHNPNLFVPPFWSNFPVYLPRPLRGHCSVLYNGRMIVIGGYCQDHSEDMIYEIQINFPFTTKVLAKLPPSTPITGCGVVLRNDKILIFGGGETYGSATAKVTMYDITKNEFKELAPLPYEVCNMATVKYEENVILACGSDQCYFDGDVKNTIVRYNIETQKSSMLPPIKQRRSQCCAVVDGHSLVVMGGKDQNKYPLNLVRAYDFRTSSWRNIPSMNEARWGFIAAIV